MEEKTQKRSIKWVLIIITIVIPILLILMWLGFGQMRQGNEIIEMSFVPKIIITLGGLIIIFLGWIQFKHQENRDLNN